MPFNFAYFLCINEFYIKQLPKSGPEEICGGPICTWCVSVAFGGGAGFEADAGLLFSGVCWQLLPVGVWLEMVELELLLI